ncbi:MAG: biosynthetic-type acetolactate synthase large subunit, partial [Spirochaetia bacterium]|nr:biosynthetic-type acetolactate synthase large subunit [Spirochaetia bacterium]
MNGARILIESLLCEGVDTIFAYTGGAVISIFDELHGTGDRIRVVMPRHEQAGTHAADGYARSTGRPGVVIVTSGPGATNTITGIATAYMDSVPLVVITGQVPLAKIGTDAFQEADILGITMPITKANFLVRKASEVADTVKKAFHLATTGRPGPVLIDLPGNVQREEAEFSYPGSIELKGYRPTVDGHPKQIQTAIRLLSQSAKPLIMAGGGVLSSGAGKLVEDLADRLGIPVVCTLMGHGVAPEREELRFGPIGMHGSLYGNYAIQNADLILALGVRFSDRIIGNPDEFAPHAQIIHVDIDPAEIGKNVRADLPIVGSVSSVVQGLLKASITLDTRAWLTELTEFRAGHPLNPEKLGESGQISPQWLVSMAGRIFPDNTILATDVGQNQMWSAQFFGFPRGRTLLSSGGLGTMGFGLPAAIGAAVGTDPWGSSKGPPRPVLMISGDGGFQMNLQELATIRRYRLPVKMLVMDNAYLGMGGRGLDLLCVSRYAGTIMDVYP